MKYPVYQGSLVDSPLYKKHRRSSSLVQFYKYVKRSQEVSQTRQEATNDEDLHNVNVNENEEEDEEEASCCGGTTCCNVKLREISVNEPVYACISKSITWSTILWLITSISLVTMAWATLYFLIGDEILPGGAAYALFSLAIASYALGWGLACLPYLNLPPVFGMLLAGIILRNTGFHDIQEKIGHLPTAKIRTFCLTFITLRAGLQLTTTPLKRHPFFIFFLALFPCTIEMLAVAFCTHYILDYPWDWAFLTGSIIACMSPVVTVNCILALADRGYGEDKGMATLLCTASSIDDVHIVSLYSICFSIVFSVDAKRTEWWAYIPGGLRDILGFIAGSLLGIFFIYFPHRKARYVTLYRLGGLILGALMCTTAASTIAITGGGYLATVVMSFIATTGWRLTSTKFDVVPMRKAIFFIWHFMQPILVGVIGTDIHFADWSAGRFGLYVVCILIGLMVRSIGSVLSACRTNFNMKEKIFVALSWLSKGTLQAALAPMTYEQAKFENDAGRLEIALDIAALAPMTYEQAKFENDAGRLEIALDIVKISVVSMIFLAPLGAIIMMISGPLLLNKITEDEARRERHLSHLRTANQLQPIFVKKRRGKTVLGALSENESDQTRE